MARGKKELFLQNLNYSKKKDPRKAGMVSPLIYVTVICCSKIQLSHCDNNLMQNGIKHTQTHAHTLIYKNDWDLFKKKQSSHKSTRIYYTF